MQEDANGPVNTIPIYLEVKVGKGTNDNQRLSHKVDNRFIVTIQK